MDFLGDPGCGARDALPREEIQDKVQVGVIQGDLMASAIANVSSQRGQA